MSDTPEQKHERVKRHKAYQARMGWHKRSPWVHDDDWPQVQGLIDRLNAARGAGRSGYPMQPEGGCT